LESEAVYEAVTRGIRVCVVPEFQEDQSSPEESFYFWNYTVEIINECDHWVQLESRVWNITDGWGRTEDVEGAGVVGQTPRIEGGDSFSYTSGCPLPTPSGIMVGQYNMIDETGARFAIAIPAFSLDSPYMVRSVN
jgi:ApaG protein